MEANGTESESEYGKSILGEASLHSPTLLRISFSTPRSLSTKRSSAIRAFMDASVASSPKDLPVGLDAKTEEDYASLSKLLQEFTSIPNIDKAWTFKSNTGTGSQAMFSISQANLLANKRRKYALSANISKGSGNSVSFQWSPFPVEMTGVSTIVPSPSGLKLLVVRNPENESPTRFEIWNQGQVEKEFNIPQSVHGSVFEGISWNSNETLVAYVAEEASPSKPTFNDSGYKKGGSGDNDCRSWKGQGEWEEDWGETYAGKRQPALFLIDTNSGQVHPVKGISKSLSIGQVIWAPSTHGLHQYLVFVGWSSNPRKLGIKYCYNRPCALYAVRAPIYASEANDLEVKESPNEDSPVLNLTQSISSAFFPSFSPDGRFLVFLSGSCSVDSGAHSATDSLHRIDWPVNGQLSSSKIIDVIPIVQSAEDGCFPGLYCSNFISNPWLSDGCTMIVSSAWGSSQVILSVNVLSGVVSRISPTDSNFSWNLLALDGDNIIAVSSSPVDVPQIKYGYLINKAAWDWSDVSSPIFRCSTEVNSLLSSRQFTILKIPVKDVSDCLTKGASKPFEAIFVSRQSKMNDVSDPLIVVLHGGPHSVSLSAFAKSYAFLSSLGYSLLIVNYRGSLGFGEEALQSLPGKVGSQDVNDVITAIDHVIDTGVASPSKIAVIGGSHGGFLTTHLIGQAPDKFVAAAARNPVCNLASMVGITDIPDWCYVETYGVEGKTKFTEAPSVEDLTLFHNKSPISHISKVKTPVIFVLGAQDLRVPLSNGLQYARALKERGVEVKILMFPNDVHAIERPQSDYEGYLNIAVWFNKRLTEKRTPIEARSRKLGAGARKRSFSIRAFMDAFVASSPQELPVRLDAKTEEDYASLSKLLQEFTSIPNIDKAWTFKSNTGTGSQAMFSISQANLLANKRRKYVVSANISKGSGNSVSFQWSPFPVEMTGVSTIVPSPSGLKLLVVRNPENESPCAIWNRRPFSNLVFDHRGSTGFGEEAFQSLLGNVGSQDVNDVIKAIDHVIDTGVASPFKIVVIGGPHGGFLTTHLIGQAPDKFVAAAARNPACNLASMVGITDIPDWCYVETYGVEGKTKFTEAPSVEDLSLFHNKSPISHISKRGIEVKILMFPNDEHPTERPQSDYESNLNIAVWFNKYCK
ncbi:hypothetical protein SADUNF_Sadunf08G0130700 [Salix dunnii]|uniref:acylaminoacyl-peptidase n=1 Tax=Salix dunnii TaxID=1413687 RepID=A0A835MY32_9ROSI|nr:hypothetical protein SADUNF_Sadunf08G0130700 [Salix dunnii]